MSAYVPRHERQPHGPNLPAPEGGSRSPRYGPPESEGLETTEESEDDRGVGPSRKRLRVDEEEYGEAQGDREDWEGHNGHHGYGEEYAGGEQQHGHQDDHHHHQQPLIPPSIFGVAPRNPVTKTIGEFIMQHAQGKEHIEIEIKLGTIMATTGQGEPPRRVRMPTMTELVIPPDYPTGSFFSSMTKHQNQSINRLMNAAAENSLHSPFPIKFYRAQQKDSFFNIPSSFRGGGKVRVSRDRAGNVIPDGIVLKRRLGNLDIYSPGEAFDWRVSVNTETPVDMPQGEPAMTRDKDRACYRHQTCQVDLTVVSAKDTERGQPSLSYELEIEVRDAPRLIAEGEKEQQGLPNVFDEMLQSVLDTARMIIRNVES